MKGQRRRKVEWRASVEGGPAHAYLHVGMGISATSVCHLNLPVPWKPNREHCAACKGALARLW